MKTANRIEIVRHKRDLKKQHIGTITIVITAFCIIVVVSTSNISRDSKRAVVAPS
jgi:hypothetical protein